MEFVEFKLPDKIGQQFCTDHFISYIITDHNGFRIAFSQTENDYDIVFDFGYAVEDYRVSDEGRRLEHHVGKTSDPWLLTEVKNSEYLKKLNIESEGILLAINPDLKHYITGDIDYSIDIISRGEPEVYKEKRICKNKR